MSHATVRVAALAAVALVLASCGLPPGLRIRDDYMGKRLFDRVTNHNQPVTHDELGNPIIRPREPVR